VVYTVIRPPGNPIKYEPDGFHYTTFSVYGSIMVPRTSLNVEWCVTLFTHYSPLTQNTKENRQEVSKEYELRVRRPVSAKPSVYFGLLTKITWLKNRINVSYFKTSNLIP